MLGVDYLGLSYYQLTGEQLAVERQRNQSTTVEESMGDVHGASQAARDADSLTYYRELCKEFSDYSFRLGDRAEGMKRGVGEVWLGFHNEMNQIGENYSYPGQVSIEIDIGVIRRMQEDSEFEAKVKAFLSQVGKDYDLYEEKARQSGCRYTVLNIYEENGKIKQEQTCTYSPFSTEQEVRQMWGKDAWKEYWEAYYDRMKNEILENFFQMALDRPREERMKEQMEYKEDDGLFSERPLEASEDWRTSEGLDGMLVNGKEEPEASDDRKEIR